MNKLNEIKEIFKNNVLINNPTFVQLLGMCPTLATTTSATNALGMGLAATAVLMLSNVLISLLRKIIPGDVRIASYIVVISGVVSAIELLIKAYVPSLYDALGLFIPLIVVNCIILARAEAYASKNNVFKSFLDGLSTGLGFTASLTVIGIIRELLGTGKVFGFAVMPSFYQPAIIFILPAGAFFTLGTLVAVVQKIKNTNEEKKKAKLYPPENEEVGVR